MLKSMSGEYPLLFYRKRIQVQVNAQTFKVPHNSNLQSEDKLIILRNSA